MTADDKHATSDHPHKHNPHSPSLPEASRRCGACGAVWLAIGFKSVLANSCLFCGARLDLKENE